MKIDALNVHKSYGEEDQYLRSPLHGWNYVPMPP